MELQARCMQSRAGEAAIAACVYCRRMTLRVATLNVWNRLGPWEQRRELIRKGIAELSPDIMGIQEVIRMTGEMGGFDQLHEIADGLGYQTAYGRNPDAPAWANGNSILSRWPIPRSLVLPLP